MRAERAVQHLRAQDVERADEGGDKARARPVVDLEGRADLLGLALVHDDDAVGDRQRLFLVVRHEDRGDAEILLDRADLLAERHAHLGVERGERLIEKQHCGFGASARASATRCCWPPESW